MKRSWGWAVLLLIPMALYTLGLAHGRPRAAYSPSTVQNAWLHQDSLAKELLELADSTPYQALELAG